MIAQYLILLLLFFCVLADQTHFSAQKVLQILGNNPGDSTSWRLEPAGDPNGDGFPDFLISARTDPFGVNGAGQVFLFYGNSSLPDPLLLSDFSAANGVVFNGNAGIKLTNAMAAVGDVNNDTFDDFVFSNMDGNGRAYLIFGNATLPSVINISSIDGINGVTFEGNEFNDFFGQGDGSISSAGDFNGDGIADLMFSAMHHDVPGTGVGGEVYVIFGNTTFPHPFSMSTLNGANGFRFQSNSSFEYLGRALTFLPDINSDGKDEIIMSIAPLGVPGMVIILFGSDSYPATLSVTDFNSSQGRMIMGSDFIGEFGHDVSSVGDIDGDGLSDLVIVQKMGTQRSIYQCGAAFLYYGSAITSLDFISYALDFNETQGVIFQGIDPDNEMESVASLGDINGDGFNDILLGAPNAAVNGVLIVGQVYVVYGKQGGLPHQFPLDSLDGFNGFTFDGWTPESADFGSTLAGIGDFNNDGFSDFAIGDIRPNVFAGAAYLILGGNATSQYRNYSTFDLVPCPAGSFAPLPIFTSNSSKCTPCSKGYFKNNTATASCIICSVGTYADTLSSTECKTCPLGYVEASTLGSTQIDEACQICPVDTYKSNTTNACIACPTKVSKCATEGMLYPLPAPGYINKPGSQTEFVPCYPHEACPGSFFSKCSKGYANPDALCSDCESGYQRYNSKCIKGCSNTVFVPILVIFYLLLSLIIVYLANSPTNQTHLPSALIIFTTIQTFAVVGFVKVLNPTSLWTGFFDFLSSASLLSFDPMICNAGDFVSSTILSLLAPIFAMVALSIILALLYTLAEKTQMSKLRALVGQNAENNGTMTLQSVAYLPIILILYIMHPFTTKTAISTFSCRIIDESNSVTNGIQCGSSEWWSVAWLSILILLIYSIGFPLYLYKRDILSRFFKPKYKYWEVIRLLYLSFLVLFVSVFPDPTQHLTVAFGSFLFCSTMFIAIQKIEPYSNPIHTKMEKSRILGNTLAFGFTIIFSVLGSLVSFILVLVTFLISIGYSLWMWSMKTNPKLDVIQEAS